MKHTIVALSVAGMLHGCAVYSETAANVARAAVDRNIEVLRFNLCALPFSALVRHPDMVPVVRAACVPAGAAGNPVVLLDQISAR